MSYLQDFEFYHRETEDGLIITVIPLTFNRARITVGRDRMEYLDGW